MLRVLVTITLSNLFPPTTSVFDVEVAHVHFVAGRMDAFCSSLPAQAVSGFLPET